MDDGLAAEDQITLKWGEVALGGFQIVPDLLLKNQRVLGLSPTDLGVILNVLMSWWYAAEKPYLRPTSIARRMGVTVRTVQRSIALLQSLGLVERKKERGRTVIDPDGLVRRLRQLAATDPDYLVRKVKRNAA